MTKYYHTINLKQMASYHQTAELWQYTVRQSHNDNHPSCDNIPSNSSIITHHQATK